VGVDEKRKKLKKNRIRLNPSGKSGHVHTYRYTNGRVGTHLNTNEIRSGDDYSTIIARGGE
jgi:hypothetical protein